MSMAALRNLGAGYSSNLAHSWMNSCSSFVASANMDWICVRVFSVSGNVTGIRLWFLTSKIMPGRNCLS